LMGVGVYGGKDFRKMSWQAETTHNNCYA